MKKVLIISLNALPMDVVSSYRAKAYCKHFFEHGIYPTLLTTRYEAKKDGSFVLHDVSDGIIEEVYSTHKIIRLPKIQTAVNKSRFHTLINFAKGDFDVGLIPTYKLYKKYLYSHLKKNEYDLIIGIFSPHFHLKLAFEAGIHFNIPYILDFRDLWGQNRVAKLSYSPNLKEKFEDFLIKFWWKRWMRHSIFYTVTSKDWLSILNNVSGKKNGHIIRNGIDSFHFKKKKGNSEMFKIVFFGSLYPEQDLSIFLQGFKSFASRAGKERAILEFVGLKEKYRPGVKKEILSRIPDSKVLFTQALSKENLISHCADAGLLWYPAFTSIKGWFSAKLYDYMALGKQIVISPGDKGEVDEFITQSKAGVILNTSKEVEEFLEEKYSEFFIKDQIFFSPNRNLLEGYTRKAQVKRMAVYINENLR